MGASGRWHLGDRFVTIVWVSTSTIIGQHVAIGNFAIRNLDFGDMGGSGGSAALASALPGETVQVTVALGKPVALDTGQTFAIREGGRTVGAGTVTALLE